MNTCGEDQDFLNSTKIKEEPQGEEEESVPFVKVCDKESEDGNLQMIAVKEEPLSNEGKDDLYEEVKDSVANNEGIKDAICEFIEIKEETSQTKEEGETVECILSDDSTATKKSRTDEIDKNRVRDYCERNFPLDLSSFLRDIQKGGQKGRSTSPPRKRLKCNVSEKAHYALNVGKFKKVSPIDVFKLFFNDEVLELIVAATNMFQEQCCADSGKPWQPVTRHCIETFFGILMLMDLNCQPDYSCYWSKNKLYGNKLVQSKMTYGKFRKILRFLSFTPYFGYDECNKLAKLQPLINILSQRFKIFTPGEKVIFYERKISVGDVTNSRYEYRLFKLCSDEGYTWNFKIDIGKEAPLASRISTVERIILSLMDGLLNEARILYVSNFYASFELARKLLAKNTYVCGSLKAHGGDVRHNAREAILTSLPDDGGRVAKGKGILQYEIDFENAKTGAALSDHMLEVSSPLQKCRAWYIKAACELLIGCAVANAFILYNKYHATYQMTFTRFREAIILSLLDGNPSSEVIECENETDFEISSQFRSDEESSSSDDDDYK